MRNLLKLFGSEQSFLLWLLSDSVNSWKDLKNPLL